jgi:Cytochrome P450
MPYAQVLIFLIVAYGLYRYTTRDSPYAHLPPHVRGWPLINQTLAHLQEDPTDQVIAWAKEYGELFRTTSATTTFIWINSPEAFKELIDRRSAIYSSRHPQPMAHNVASAGRRIAFMPYGKEWRALRGIIHRVISPIYLVPQLADFRFSSSLPKCHGHILQPKHLRPRHSVWIYLTALKTFICIIVVILLALLCKLYTASVYLVVKTLAEEADIEGNCEDISNIYKVTARFSTFRRPGTFIVDTFPQLANLPLFDLISPWRKRGAAIQKEDEAIYREFWNRMKRSVEDGTAVHSWGKGFVQSDYTKHGIDELGAIYAA